MIKDSGGGPIENSEAQRIVSAIFAMVSFIYIYALLYILYYPSTSAPFIWCDNTLHCNVDFHLAC